MLGASFQIGRSALAAYQAAISIAGQNIANVGNPDYARQTGRLTALRGGQVFGGVTPGAGVQLSQLRRHVDESLESRLRLSLSTRTSADVLYNAITQTETLYGELSTADVSTQFSELFGSFGNLQTSPADSSSRDLVIAGADTLIRSLQRQRAGLVQQVVDLNDAAIEAANSASQIADEIARLNEQVVQQESDGVTVASALRDRRDQRLRDLAELMDIQTREQPTGAVNVYVGSEPLVEFNRSRGLTIERRLEDGLEIAQVRFADNGGSVQVRQGKLAALIAARDVHIRDQLDRIDTLARGLIYEVNRIHSTGVGLVGYSSITGEFDVEDPSAALNSAAADMTYPVQNGTFLVHVRDTATGQVISRQIEVDLDGLNGDDTSLSDLAAALDGVPGLTASVTSDNRLQASADAGSEMWFTEDSSGALAALGVGAFFKGESAADIDIVDAIRSDPRRIAASASGEVNDGGVAGRLAVLADSDATSPLLNNRSIQNYHADMIGDLAVEGGAALTAQEASDAVFNGLVAQREAVSGVSLDEEAINLTRYEQAYQGAARYIGVLQQMTNELVNLL